jgi:LacI family repressor for deo operon, udp, cdd, tsx, nupC, and nupG
MSNIREVAQAAGVSVATVSRALTNPEKVSEESLKKVHDAIKVVGYRPNLLARSFRAAKSFSVVVLVPDITNPFFSQVIQAIEDRAQQKGYAVLLGDTRETSKREQEYVNRVETRLADGVIQLRPQSMSSSTQPIPWVNACGCEGTPGPSVRIDNVGAAKTMVDYLISLGHKRIGVISGLKDNPHSIDRLKGYKASLAAAGIPFNEELVVEGNFTMWSGQNAAKQFFSLEQMPTAIFCMNDEMAIGAIQTLKAEGLSVPKDVSVTGFDDINYAKYWDPALTTMAQPAEEIGKRAMDLLLRIIEGEELSNVEAVLPSEIMIRQSACPPKM